MNAEVARAFAKFQEGGRSCDEGETGLDVIDTLIDSLLNTDCNKWNITLTVSLTVSVMYLLQLVLTVYLTVSVKRYISCTS